MRYIGPGLALIAIGAILKFAVTYKQEGVDLPLVGVILMVVGAVAVLAGAVYASTRRRTDIVQTPQGTVIREPREPMV